MTPRRLLLPTLLLLVAGSALPSPARGQDQQPALESGSRESEPLRFRDELNIPARAISSPTSTTTVIERETIEASSARTVAELLASVEGVHILSSGSRGGLSAAQIRGGDPNFSLVLLDGVPLNNSTDLEGGAFNLAALSTSHIERIEIVRGPQSYFYGPQGLAGLINIVTRRGDSAIPMVRAGLEAGSFSALHAETSVSGLMGKRDYFVGVEWEEEAERLGDDSFEQLGALSSVGLPIGDQAKLRLSARVASSEADDYPEGSGGPVFGSGELRHTERNELVLGADLVLAGVERWHHRVIATLRAEDIERASPPVGFVVPASVEDISYSRFQASWVASHDLSDSLLLAAGIDVETEDAENDSVLFLPPFLGGAVAGDYDLSRTTPGAFVEVGRERGNLLLEVGLRADHPEQGDTEWSPRLGIRYRLGNSGSVLRATARRGFKLPSFLALASPPALGGNPGLVPETSRGGDLGLEHEFSSGSTTVGASAFWTRYEDLIEFDFDAFQLVNRSRVEARGAELYLRWHPSAKIRLDASLTWQDVEDLDVSDTPLHHPEWRGGVGLVWQPDPALTLSLRARSTSMSLDQQLTAPDRDSVAGYEAFDLNLAWQATDRWMLTVRVENLTDTDYENLIGFPAPGRAGRVGLRYRVAQRSADAAPLPSR